MSKSREGYGFSRQTKQERLDGVRGKCEGCGRTDRLYAHHMIPVCKAKKNRSLFKRNIKSEENCQMLCTDCHREADEYALSLPPRELGILAWALFDQDPKEVEQNQGTPEPQQQKRRNRRRRRRRR